MDCSICLDFVSIEEEFMTTTCMHTFHTTCWNTWCCFQKEQRRRPTCPLCRRPHERNLILHGRQALDWLLYELEQETHLFE